jgi:coenzyme F420-0:L-glutamate ligase / coenzyme F420-1:gamma-L-glutamate ligase
VNKAVTVLPLEGIPEISEGDDVAALICKAAEAAGFQIEDGDVVVVTQKIVSKAEGRLVDADPEDEEARDAVIASQSVRILRRKGSMVIAETAHGLVCANAGVDASNVPAGKLSLLPADPDKSARAIRTRIKRHTGRSPAVIISDTFGRAWRVGQTNVAIGVAGIAPVTDYRGSADHNGVELKATMIAVADEIASAAELVMGKSDRVPVAIVRGLGLPAARGSAKMLVRNPQDDLFR